MTDYVDFKIINTEHGLDIDFEEDYSQAGSVFNMFFKHGRNAGKNKTALLSRGGCIGDVLVNEDNRTGSLIYQYKEQYQGKELERNVTAELNRKIDKLIKTKIIDSAEIENVVAQGRILYIKMHYVIQGKKELLDINI